MFLKNVTEHKIPNKCFGFGFVFPVLRGIWVNIRKNIEFLKMGGSLVPRFASIRNWKEDAADDVESKWLETATKDPKMKSLLNKI